MLEKLVAEYGEKNRRWIEAALKFLDENEDKWGVKIDREEYIRDLYLHLAKDA